MRFITFLILSILPFSSLAEMMPSSFVVGKYLAFGEELDSDKTYKGTVIFFEENGQLKVKREINNKVVLGIASFESALGGDASVLRVRYSKNGKNVEQTCLVGGDLDNYARITCYVYEPEVRTNDPGMEALFIDHNNK
jgi:hypothetical protein